MSHLSLGIQKSSHIRLEFNKESQKIKIEMYLKYINNQHGPHNKFWFHKVQLAKKESYPKDLVVTEVKAEIRMESLLHHTAERLVKFLELKSDEFLSLKMVSKYGFDGTNSSSYKQKWNNGTGNDEHIFCASIAPLQLINVDNGQILWTNPRPSSPRFCRPLLIEFAKETSELCKQKRADFESQIGDLQPCMIGNITIRFELSLTMIDGKVGVQ